MRKGSVASAFLGVMRRDALSLWRRRSDALNPLWFAAIVVTLFPLALGPEAAKLARVAGGLIWVIVLLASLLSLDALFRADLEEGSLDLMLTSAQPLAVLAAAKILLHWLATGLPLLAITPIAATALGLSPKALPVLLTSLALGTPIISVIGACAAALTAGLRRSGTLLSLIVLPLVVPVLIFGAGAVEASLTGASTLQPMLFLAAGLAAAVTLGPLVCAAALRLGNH
jgi:heme exporter protein B